MLTNWHQVNLFPTNIFTNEAQSNSQEITLISIKSLPLSVKHLISIGERKLFNLHFGCIKQETNHYKTLSVLDTTVGAKYDDIKLR